MTDRRYAVPFDPDYFSQKAKAGEQLTAAEAFRHAWKANLWSGNESRSGPGSSLDQTTVLRGRLPTLFRELGVRSLLDVPCGDWRWMSTIDLGSIEYIGGDLLVELVEANRQNYGTSDRRFVQLDLTASPLPRADLILCRDCLVHLSFADVAKAIDNIRRSEITWLLTTTFPSQPDNLDIVTGDWRPINLQASPFGLPQPKALINEGCTEGGGIFGDKSLGLWRIADL